MTQRKIVTKADNTLDWFRFNLKIHLFLVRLLWMEFIQYICLSPFFVQQFLWYYSIDSLIHWPLSIPLHVLNVFVLKIRKTTNTHYADARICFIGVSFVLPSEYISFVRDTRAWNVSPKSEYAVCSHRKIFCTTHIFPLTFTLFISEFERKKCSRFCHASSSFMFELLPKIVHSTFLFFISWKLYIIFSRCFRSSFLSIRQISGHYSLS